MNKYYKIYQNIIENAKSSCRLKTDEVYYELHHIVPRSLGGNNSTDNLVLLTYKEHFICHHLLCKFTSGLDKSKMIYAFWCLVNKEKIPFSKREKYKEEFIKRISMTNKLNKDSRNEKRYLTNLRRYGYKHNQQNPEMKEKTRKSLLEYYKLHPERQKGVDNGNYGNQHSSETKRSIGDSSIKRKAHLALLTDESRQKSKQTSLSKYGVENYMCSPELNKMMRSKIGDTMDKLINRCGGWIHTPWGSFLTAIAASKAAPFKVDNFRLMAVCKSPEHVIVKKNLCNSPLFDITSLGKTHKELGYWFEPKEIL